MCSLCSYNTAAHHVSTLHCADFATDGLEYPTNGPEKYGLTNYSKGPKRNYQVGGTGSEFRAQKYGKLWDAETQTPWYKFQMEGQWQQGYYDDARSVTLKYELATAGNVSGLFIWPLNGNSLSTAAWAWEALAASVGPRDEA